MPIDAQLNATKSNKLPPWERFFKRFAENQHLLYQQIQADGEIRALFLKCRKDNLHALWASEELYVLGNSHSDFIARLESGIRPVYEAAKRQGYEMWEIDEKW